MNWYKKLAQKTVSFDFDSTLTSPYWSHKDGYWHEGDPSNPDHVNWGNVQKLISYAEKGYRVIIVTSRSEREKPEVEDFVRRHNLPVSEIHATGGDKGAKLNEVGSIRHYDDMHQQHDDEDGQFQGEWEKIHHPGDKGQ